jgi:hypothetical protein
MAASGFEVVRIFGGENKASAIESGSLARSGAAPVGCESCKNTPSNRFTLLAKQDAVSEGTKLDVGRDKEGGAAAGSLLTQRWAKRALLANASADVLVEEIRKFKGFGFRMKDDPDIAFAVARLAELQPERAADLWAKTTEFRSQPELFLKGWLRKDPAAFLAWNLTQSADVQKAGAGVLGKLAKESPEQFTALAGQLSLSAAGPGAARSAVQELRGGGKDDSEKALVFAQSLPAGAMRNAALSELLTWGEFARGDLQQEKRAEMLAALTQIDPEDAKRMGRNLGAIATELPAGVARESAFAASLRDQARKDSVAAAQRLDALAGSPDYAAAVRGFVAETAAKDPAAAAEWALSIPESTSLQRMAALERVASGWFKASPDEARAWVEKAPLTDAEYFRLTGRPRQR